MPKDINLLPNELRHREEKLQKSKPDEVVTLHMPENPIQKILPSLKESHTTIISRLKSIFTKKKIPLISTPAPEPKKSIFVPPVSSLVPQASISLPPAKKSVTSMAMPPVLSVKESALHIPKQVAYKIFGINLLRAHISKTSRDGVPLRWIALGVGMIFLTIVYFVSWSLVEFKKTRTLQSQKTVRETIATLEQEWLNLHPSLAQAAIKEERINAAQILLENRKLWTKVFDFLEEYTVDGVSYQLVQIDSSGTKASFDLVATAYEIFVYQLVVFDGLTEIVKSYEFGDIVLVNEKNPLSKDIAVSVTIEFTDAFLGRAR